MNKTTHEKDRVEWKGNVLSKEGVTCVADGVRAELMRVAADFFGMVPGFHKKIARTWILTISDDRGRVFGNEDVMCSVLIPDATPARAMEEAATIFLWAVKSQDGAQ